LEDNFKKSQAKADSLAKAVAHEVFKAQKAGASDEPIVKSLLGALAADKVEIIEYDGCSFNEELSLISHVVEWLPGDEDHEIVAHTLLPEIRREGRLIHQARLSCRKALVVSVDSPDFTFTDSKILNQTDSPTELLSYSNDSTETSSDFEFKLPKQNLKDDHKFNSDNDVKFNQTGADISFGSPDNFDCKETNESSLQSETIAHNSNISNGGAQLQKDFSQEIIDTNKDGDISKEPQTNFFQKIFSSIPERISRFFNIFKKGKNHEKE
jgi:hypothetical protein